MKISVGIPVYDSKLQMQSVASLLTETSLAAAIGDTLSVIFLPSCTNLAMGRNQIVKEFLASDSDRLVFLDADVTFEPGALLRIAHYPVDMVGGAYRLKTEAERYPITLLNEPREAGPGGIVEVAMVPTGFLSLSRGVFEKFRTAYPDREYAIDGKRAYCYFQIPYSDGLLFTEDAYFCREWRAAGGQIYLDPEITMTHWDQNKPYRGHIGNWFRSRTKGAA
jgi:glycosyltransferase involved in cell wall biosynthesis